MLILPRLVTVMGACAPMVLKHVLAHGTLLMVDVILAPRKRTATSMLRAMGQSDNRHSQRDHRVLSRSRWATLWSGRMLPRWLRRAFMATDPVVIGINEALERRRGAKMAPTGINRDPVCASHKPVVNASGWRWVSLMLLGRRAPGPCLPGECSS